MMTVAYKVDGVEMPDASIFKPLLADADNGTARMANGYLKRKRVRSSAKKFSVEYNYVTATDVATILTAIKPESFTLTYVDPEDNTEKTGTFYASDRDLSTQKIASDGTRSYENLKFRLVEY